MQQEIWHILPTHPPCVLLLPMHQRGMFGARLASSVNFPVHFTGCLHFPMPVLTRAWGQKIGPGFPWYTEVYAC